MALGPRDARRRKGAIRLGCGLDAKTCRRGSLGVGPWLSSRAAAAWEAAGGEFLVQTPGLIGGIAIRLTVQNDRGRDVSMVLASGVAIELSGAYYADVDALNSTSTPTKSSFFVATPTRHYLEPKNQVYRINLVGLTALTTSMRPDVISLVAPV